MACGWVVVLAVLVGCTSEGPEQGSQSSTGDGETTTVEPPSSGEASSSASSGASSGASSSGAAQDESTTAEEPTSCHDPRPIPLSRFDCRGADGVAPVSVIIEEGDDPSILEGVRRVEGSLRIDRTSLTNLDFMGCLEEVTGDVTIHGNDALTNVDGLWSLRSLGGNFMFSHNDALTGFDGVPNLETMKGTLVIDGNASLEDITGFHSLVGIQGERIIDPVEVIDGGNLWIRNNPVLRSIDGLGQLLVLNGIFVVSYNPSLCISSVDCVGSGIVEPATPPASWLALGNDESC